MSSKGHQYSAKSDFDEFDSIGEKLALDLRRSIRHLDNYPILSDPWMEMAEIFGRVANISDVESALPSAKKDATLWETEEQALRFLLEDGKLNLCLRILIEFKTRQIEARKTNRGPLIDFTAICDKFEKGLGIILRNAWQHVEVLQTTDIPALSHYIADVLTAFLQLGEVSEDLMAKTDLAQRQEVLVFYYLHGLMKHLDEMHESRIMPIVRERQLFVLAVKALNMLGPRLLKAHLLKACEALALLVDSEDYLTHRSQYFQPEDLEELLLFKDGLLAQLMAESKDSFDTRKLIRPLIDAIDKIKRAAGGGGGSNSNNGSFRK